MMGRPPTGGLVSNGYRTDPVEVSAAILAKLARDASGLLGFPVREAVITVPAHFGDRERSATKAAAERAGLHVLQMINEPSAAALTYTHGQQVEPGAVLVFDLVGEPSMPPSCSLARKKRACWQRKALRNLVASTLQMLWQPFCNGDMKQKQKRLIPTIVPPMISS